MVKQKILVAITFFIVSLFTLNAQAANTHLWSKIDDIYPLADGRVVLIFRDDAPACTSSANPKFYYVAVGSNDVTAEGLQNIYSAAMFAAAQNLTVKVYFDDSDWHCYINRLRVIM